MKGLRCFVLAMAAAVSMPGNAADAASWPLQEGLHLYPYQPSDAAHLSPHVLVFLPPGYEARRWPMIVLFHGAGQRGQDFEKLKANLAVKYAQAHPEFAFILALPQAPATVERFDPAETNALIDELAKRLPVDPSRISLSGSSMGGIATWQVALAAPHRFAAIAPVSSKLDPEQACALKDTPVWAFHNEQDKLIAPEPVKDAIGRLQACKGSARLTLYPKTGHDAWTETYANPALYEWLAAQRR